MRNPDLVPAEVLEAYGLGGAAIQQLSDARTNSINTTYLAENGTNKVILQDMSHIFRPDGVDDFATVTEHLTAKGWEVPLLVKTASGDTYLPGAHGRFWRASTFIESDGKVPEYSIGLLRAVGALIGKLHVDLADLNYTPRFTLPRYHDTGYYMTKLRDLIPAIPRDDTKQLAHDLLEQYRANPSLPEGEPQLIHADIRANNALYRDGQPFTAIDFDTVMVGSPWIDIGDFLRSAGEEERLRGRSIGREAVAAFCEAYRAVARPDAEPAEFLRKSLDAARLITIELAARFAIDAAENRYFVPPPGQDRRTFVADRANLQWQIFQDFTAIKEGEQ